MRGEYVDSKPDKPADLELPPRARRIHSAFLRLIAACGTTSACAENTVKSDCVISKTWNYLRVRGEYATSARRALIGWELPPRARRIPAKRQTDRRTGGTTSACAENTFAWNEFVDSVRNYLRVRGEYISGPGAHRFLLELPPRARRIPLWCSKALTTPGTTSACAENTLNELGLL